MEHLGLTDNFVYIYIKKNYFKEKNKLIQSHTRAIFYFILHLQADASNSESFQNVNKL